MQVYIIVSIASLLVGAGSTYLITQKDPPPAPPIIITPTEDVAKEQQEIIKQLTDTDLLVIPCSKEYIESNDNLLCREMFCRMMSRGIDSKTSGQECEEISNIANSQYMIEHCEQITDSKDQCYKIYTSRK